MQKFIPNHDQFKYTVIKNPSEMEGLFFVINYILYYYYTFGIRLFVTMEITVYFKLCLICI